VKRFSFIVALVLSASAGLPAVQSSAVQSSFRPPHARSQQEYDDYRAALAAGNAGAVDRAATVFAAKYPQSELREYLFARAMSEYQLENNPEGMLSAGENVLALDPGQPLALVLTATALADRLGPTDADRDKEIAEVKRNAGRVIQGGKSRMNDPAAQPQAALYRSTLQGMAYSALGIVHLKTGDYEEAEKDLKAAIDLCKRPDAYLWYHLALAQDHRRKFRMALNSVEQAMQLASSNPELQKMAEVEHERLIGYVKNSPASGGSRSPE
jgi:tetratricopeptide (TPR) repeat protein